MKINSLFQATVVAFVSFVCVGCAGFDISKPFGDRFSVPKSGPVVTSSNQNMSSGSTTVTLTPLADHHGFAWLGNNPIPASKLPPLPAEHESETRRGRYNERRSIRARNYSSVVMINGKPYLETTTTVTTNISVWIDQYDRNRYNQTYTPDPNGPKASTVGRGFRW